MDRRVTNHCYKSHSHDSTHAEANAKAGTQICPDTTDTTQFNDTGQLIYMKNYKQIYMQNQTKLNFT